MAVGDGETGTEEEVMTPTLILVAAIAASVVFVVGAYLALHRADRRRDQEMRRHLERKGTE